ncbi:MAG TPA: TonB-dependent receptor [Opitutaceae bacterium]|nr:TonB-dependent receptor [Opitutaceae bacterium]
MPFPPRRLTGVLFLALLGALAANFVYSAEASSLEGRVLEVKDGAPISSARVQVGNLTAMSDAAGHFAFSNLAPGKHAIEISAPDHNSIQMEVELQAGDNFLNPKLAYEVIEMGKIVVTDHADAAANAFAGKSAAESLTEVVSDAALKRSTAQNTSDLLKTVPGVSVTTGADGSTNIAIRGLNSKFNRVTIDGQRQSSSSILDSVPPEVVKSLEVTKALTPDMDADAIGGVINVTTGGAANIKQPFIEGHHQVTYDTLGNRPGSRNSLTVGRPFRLFSKNPAKPDAGFLLTASYDDQYRWRENFETQDDWPLIISPGPAPFAGVGVPAFTQARLESTLDHSVHSGLLFNTDVHLGDATSIYFRSDFNRDERLRNRDRQNFDVAGGTPLALTPTEGVFSGVFLDRSNIQQDFTRDLATLSTGGKTAHGRTEIDGNAGFSYSNEEEPHTIEAIFRNSDTFTTTYNLQPNPFLPRVSFVDDTNPADTQSISDPAHYQFNSFSLGTSHNIEKELSVATNVKVKLDDSAQPSYLKFGTKIQQRRRSADATRQLYDTPAATTMAGLVGASSVPLRDVGYQIGPVPSVGGVAALVNENPSLFPIDAEKTFINSMTGDYSETETVWAAYAMGKATLGRWSVLGGVRVEGTHFTTSGNQLTLAPDGSLSGIVPAQTAGTYTQVLPSLHLRFDASPRLLFRASVTRALIRPNYQDLAPHETINFQDLTISAGNPGLKPYQATNYDFSVDRYLTKAGLVSVALFYKEISHFIAEAKLPVSLGSLGNFTESTNVNGDTARVWGVETSWQSCTWDLPAAITGSVELNYTFLRSESTLPDHPGQTLPLPEQPAHQASVTFHAEHGAFSTDLNVRYRTTILDEVATPGRDVYKRGGYDTEFNAAYKINNDFRIVAGVTGLFRRFDRSYSGDPSRLKEFEATGVVLNVGVRWKL